MLSKRRKGIQSKLTRESFGESIAPIQRRRGTESLTLVRELSMGRVKIAVGRVGSGWVKQNGPMDNSGCFKIIGDTDIQKLFPKVNITDTFYRRY